MNIQDLLSKAAAAHPDRIAVVDSDRTINFSQLHQSSRRVAAHLRLLQLPKGARVGLLWTNSIEYVVCFFAIFDAGLVAVPLDTSLDPKGLSFILSDCSVRALFAEGRFARQLPAMLNGAPSVKTLISDRALKLEGSSVAIHNLKDWMSINARASSSQESQQAVESIVVERDSVRHELAAIFYTSGSTGASKGVMLSHHNLVSNTVATVEYLKLTPNDSVLVILPFYYIYGNSLLLTHVASGGRLVIDNRFMYPEVILDTMESQQVTGFSGVPSNFMILLNNSTLTTRKLESLRYFTQAGGAMAPEVTRKLMTAFPRKEIYIMYGQTEAAPRVTWLPPEMLSEKLGSIGIPVPGVTVEVLDDNGQIVPDGETGELTVLGGNVMMGYWNQPDESRQVLRGSRLFTGDLARRDSDGYFHIVGRKKEIIKSGGNRVSAKEVEECLLAHEQIAEASVIGVRDDILGEAIKAVVVLKPGGVPNAKEIQNHCKRKLADFKVPKYVLFVDALPKYQSGKVNKLLLQNMS